MIKYKDILNEMYNIYVLDEITSDSSDKIIKIKSIDNQYILKKCNSDFDNKINYLKSMNVFNIIYPIINKNGKYITKNNDEHFFVQLYYHNNLEINEIKANNLLTQLSILHNKTKLRKSLSPLKSKKKFEEIFNYLQYKFSVLETFVRNVESLPYDEYSIVILKNYHYILDAKKIMENLNKKIINYVKDKINVFYVYLHGNPKLNHLINDNGYYLISYQNGYYGISSLDIAKYYIEVEDLNINHFELINEYFKNYDSDFYFDYFCFLVLLYYVKSIIIYDKDYVSSQSFIYVSDVIKKFIDRFKDRLN